MRVAIQGEQGSFHHAAAEAWFGEDIELICCPTFDVAFDALKSGQADTGIIAIENSLAGSLHQVYDLLLKTHVHIVGELYQHIHQCLIGLPSTPLNGITHVYSQPIALAQCSNYLTTNLPQASAVEHYDTTASVRLVKEKSDPHLAAIAGRFAAEVIGLSVLKDNIENNRHNFTRFLVLDLKNNIPDGANKTSFVLETSHKPGSLQQALSVFGHESVNITKLESRPIPNEPWHYQFFLDVSTAGTLLRTCITKLESQGCKVRILGEYVSNIALDADI